jgi:hypothetical protein
MKKTVRFMAASIPLLAALMLSGCFDTLTSSTELISAEEADYSTDLSGEYYLADKEGPSKQVAVIERRENGFVFTTDREAGTEELFFRLSPLARRPYYLLQMFDDEADKEDSVVSLMLARLDGRDIHLAPFPSLEPAVSGCAYVGDGPDRERHLRFCRLLDKHGLKVDRENREYFLREKAGGADVKLEPMTLFLSEVLETDEPDGDGLSLIRK